MEVRETNYNTEDSILYNLDPYVGKSIKISDSGIVADANGRKIVKAGSIVNKDGEIVADSNARYVVLQNVDVTAGPRSATGIYRGTVYVRKMPVAPASAVKNAIKGIIFMEDDSNY